jgi:hypothetical protein
MQAELRSMAIEHLLRSRLAPLVAVAWADGEVVRAERVLVLREARRCGLEPGTEPYERVRGWLDQGPPDLDAVPHPGASARSAWAWW